MSTYIFIAVGIGTILLALGAFIYPFHKSPSIWVFFVGGVFILLSIAFHLQGKVWEEESPKTDTKENLKPVQKFPEATTRPSIYVERMELVSIVRNDITCSVLLKTGPTRVATNVVIYVTGVLHTLPNRYLFPLDSSLSYKDLSPNEEKTIITKLNFSIPDLNKSIAEKRQFLYIFGRIYYCGEVDKKKRYQKDFCAIYDSDTRVFVDVKKYKIVHGRENMQRAESAKRPN